MEDFLYRCRLFLIGVIGNYLFMIPITALILFLHYSLTCGSGGWCSTAGFLKIPVVILLIVLVYLFWKFAKRTERLDSHYTDTEGRSRCRKCRKVVYGDQESSESRRLLASLL